MVPSLPPPETPPPARKKKPDNKTEWGCGSALGVLLWLGLASVVYSALWGEYEEPAFFFFAAVIAGVIILGAAAFLAGIAWVWKQLFK